MKHIRERKRFDSFVGIRYGGNERGRSFLKNGNSGLRLISLIISIERYPIGGNEKRSVTVYVASCAKC